MRSNLEEWDIARMKENSFLFIPSRSTYNY